MLTKDDIIATLKIYSLPSEKQDEIIQRLESIIQQKVALKTAEVLKDQEIPENSSDEEFLNIMRQKIPHFDQLVKDISVTTVNDFVKAIS